MNTPCGVTPPPPNLSKCRFEVYVCFRLAVLLEMQIQALCVEGIVGVPGSVLVLRGYSRFLVVCGSMLAPGGPLANSSRFLAVFEIKVKLDAQIDPQIKKIEP